MKPREFPSLLNIRESTKAHITYIFPDHISASTAKGQSEYSFSLYHKKKITIFVPDCNEL